MLLKLDSNKHGFSLLEFMIAIGIMGIMVFVFISNTSLLSKQEKIMMTEKSLQETISRLHFGDLKNSITNLRFEDFDSNRTFIEQSLVSFPYRRLTGNSGYSIAIAGNNYTPNSFTLHRYRFVTDGSTIKKNITGMIASRCVNKSQDDILYGSGSMQLKFTTMIGIDRAPFLFVDSGNRKTVKCCDINATSASSCTNYPANDTWIRTLSATSDITTGALKRIEILPNKSDLTHIKSAGFVIRFNNIKGGVPLSYDLNSFIFRYLSTGNTKNSKLYLYSTLGHTVNEGINSAKPISL